jgi:hypothetical protein
VRCPNGRDGEPFLDRKIKCGAASDAPVSHGARERYRLDLEQRELIE